MMRKTFLLVAIACALALPSLPSPSLAQPSSAIFSPGARQHGVCWVAGGRITREDLQPLVRDHVEWISQTPFGWQRDYDSPSITTVTADSSVYWGEKDEGIEATAKLAHELGIKTLLKPHIWLSSPSSGKWNGNIDMKSDADWQAWMSSYREFMIHYARLAERSGIEALCVGTELQQAAVKHEKDWRGLIADVRKVYHGRLTYAANWYEEFEQVAFFNDLDFIGVQAYFPLAKSEKPTVADLKAAWLTHLPSIEQIQRKFGKPIVFTEIGYKSTPDSAIEPWKWPGFASGLVTDVDLLTQANCYEAFFQTFWAKDWFGGAYIWKWYPRHERAGGPSDKDFTPQNKPAEQVMSRWYGMGAPSN